MQNEGFDCSDKIRLGAAIRLTVRGIPPSQTAFELRIGLGRVRMGAQVISEGEVPPVFVTALRHNVEVMRARMALP